MNLKSITDKKLIVQTATRFLLGAVGCFALLYTGCAMCCGPFDYHYPNYGGTIQRSDPVRGRVGSIFSDPGPLGGPSADYNLTPHEGGSGTNDIDSGSGNANDVDDLEPLDGSDTDIDPPRQLDFGDDVGSDTSDGILPTPPARPSPDESTQIRRLRNQSRRGVSRWR